MSPFIIFFGAQLLYIPLMHVDTLNLTTNLISLSFNIDNQCWNSLFSIDRKMKKPTCTEKQQPLVTNVKIKQSGVQLWVVSKNANRLVWVQSYNPLTLSNTHTYYYVQNLYFVICALIILRNGKNAYVSLNKSTRKSIICFTFSLINTTYLLRVLCPDGPTKYSNWCYTREQPANEWLNELVYAYRYYIYIYISRFSPLLEFKWMTLARTVHMKRPCRVPTTSCPQR